MVKVDGRRIGDGKPGKLTARLMGEFHKVTKKEGSKILKMVCDVCAVNQATVHLTEIIDEQMTELHLCESCAKNKSVEMEQQFGLADLLAGFWNLDKTSSHSERHIYGLNAKIAA